MDRRRPRTLIINVALAVMAVLVADFALAQLGRALMPNWDIRHHRMKFRMADPVFDHALAPQVTQIDFWGGAAFNLITNSLGGRDRTTRVVALEKSGRRISLIGDSFIEGVGYDFDLTMAGRVEAALAPRGIEVLNLAVSSYSPVIYYKKLEYLIETKGFETDELFVFVDPGDIYNESNWYHLGPDGRIVSDILGGINVDTRRDPVQSWLATNSVLGKLTYTLADLWRYHRSLRKSRDAGAAPELREDTASDARDSSWTWDAAAYEKWGRQGLQNALENMDRLAALLRRHGVRLTVAVYPWPGQILRRQAEPEHVTVFRAWAERNGADFLDLYPLFMQGSPAEVLKAWYIPGDVHWNADGHRLVAEAVLAHLQNRP